MRWNRRHTCFRTTKRHKHSKGSNQSLSQMRDRHLKALGKKLPGGHWNSGLALLRNNGLVEVSGKRLRVSDLFR